MGAGALHEERTICEEKEILLLVVMLGQETLLPPASQLFSNKIAHSPISGLRSPVSNNPQPFSRACTRSCTVYGEFRKTEWKRMFMS